MTEAQLVSSEDLSAVPAAVAVLKAGGLVAFPTDTVYGLAADVWNPTAVARLYTVKRRSELKAIPVLLSGVDALHLVVEPPSEPVLELARRFWPGPLTLVLRRRPEIPSEVSADDTLGVRVPNHEFALHLLAATGPLAVTSANRSGEPSLQEAEAVFRSLGELIELVIDAGRTPGGVPSTVVDCTIEPARLLREGPLEFSTIQRVLERARAGQVEAG